jgi:integrase/recombinase XerD
VSQARLRVVEGTAERADGADPFEYQVSCIDAYVATQVARSFSRDSVANTTGVLRRFLQACGRPAWEVTRDDVDRVVGDLVGLGMAASTRRGYVQAFKGFYEFLLARKAPEIEALFGTAPVLCPVDRFNSSAHVADASPASLLPPDVERLERFFAFLRNRVGTARKYAVAGRDYALYRTIYLGGLRAEETASLTISDVHLDRGPFGKLHVRNGKGARGSGPRPRFVPMLDRLDLTMKWYLADIRPRFGDKPPLFCDEGGGPISRGTIRNRLAYLLEMEGALPEERFTPHSLRRACATHNYERGVDLIAIQQLLGHWQVGTTMKYVSPSATFIEDAYRRALSATLGELEGDGDGG